jgi:gliding-associated putative ABC transporter substrate-binding component GldG
VKLSNKRQQTLIAALMGAALLLAAIASTQYFFRLDLTQDKAFSISKVSKNLFKEIPEQLRIVYYVSDRLYKERPEPKRVEDMLREYASSSRGRISVDVLDPEKTGEAATIERFGIMPQQYQVVEKNQASVASVYTGILIQYMDKQEVLPLVFQTASLEYDLTKAIRKVVSGKDMVAMVLLGDSEKTWDQNYKILSDVLKDSGWEVRMAEAGKLVPEDVSLLIVLGNNNLDEFDLYPVNQYLQRGGRAFLAFKGVDISTSYGIYAMEMENSSSLDMLSAWGVTLSKELVLDQSCLTIPIQVASPFGGTMISMVKYPHWVSIIEENVDANNPVTSRFAGLDLFWPSPLSVQPKEGLKVTVLARSTKYAWRSTKDFPVNPQDEMSFYAENASTAGQYDLALTLEGQFPDAFAGKPLPQREGVESDWKDKAPATTSAPGRAVLVSSSDFATDLMQYSRSQLFSAQTGKDTNAEFIASCADWLASDDDLVSIRTRSYRDTRLNKIEDAKAKQTMQFFVYLTTLVLVPMGVVAYGVVRVVRRRRHAKSLSAKEA